MSGEHRGHLGEQDTLVMGAETEQAQSDSVFPEQLSERFQLLDTLGRGGAGTVFLVFDQDLQRQVALKLLSAPKADMQTLLMEARAQARLKHPHICPIFDVGQCQQQIFMVMQFIPGLPLHKLAPQLSLEQKLIVMEQVCLGLQHAHSNSLIHRDIKPSNVLVEQDENGQLHAYIVDFGLAHGGETGVGLHHGAGLGTPDYMAPEQRHLQAADTDRRVDIFSVGATLYHLLCGQPPVALANQPQDSVAERAAKTPSEEQRTDPNREIQPQADEVASQLALLARVAPEDLQTIILKCLEPQATLRYSSAREVGLEIRRYLEGEPIKAHRGLRYKLIKKARKHRLVVALAALVLLTLAGSGGYQWHMKHQQQIREALLQDFTADVENLEAQVRFTHMSPQQNIEPLQQQWRQRVESIEQSMQQLGAIAEGPGHYAIGRMLYAFQQYPQALEHLQLAWQSGFQQPRVAYVLGLTMGEIYQASSLQALNIESPKSRAAELARLDRELRQPAIQYLSMGNQLADYQGYAQALALYLQQDYALARQTLENSELAPWFYEKYQLLSRLQLQQAEDLYSQGEKDTANQLYQQALDSAQQGLEVAPNSMLMHNVYAAILLRQVNNSLYDQGSPEQGIQLGLAATQTASQIDPMQLDNILLRADFQERLIEHRLAHSDQNLQPINQQGIEFLEQALQHWPQDSRLLRFMGSAYYQKFSLKVGQNQYDQEAIEAAKQTFSKIKDTERDYLYYVSLGQFYLDIAKKRTRFSLPREEYYEQAFAAFEQAKKLGVENPGMHVNYAAALINLGRAEFDHKGVKLIQRAINELALVSDKKNLSVASTFYLARAHYEIAKWNKNIKLDYLNDLNLATLSAEEALKLKSDNYFLWDQLLTIYAFKLSSLAETKTLNREFIQSYLTKISETYERFPNHSSAANNLSFLLLSVSESLVVNQYASADVYTFADSLLEKKGKLAKDNWYDLNQIYKLYIQAIQTHSTATAELHLAQSKIEKLNNKDDWSLNLKAKIYALLAIRSSEAHNYWIAALNAQNQAVKKLPYKMEYHSRLACLIKAASTAGIKQQKLAVFNDVQRPAAIAGLPLTPCKKMGL